MYSTGRRHVAFFLVVLLAFGSVSFARAQEEKSTPKGSKPATKDDLEWMKWAGLPPEMIKEGTNINPDDPNIGKEMGEIKKWLAAHATKNSKIRCLNPEFARKLKKFMEAVPGGPPTITDGYRSIAQQQSIINRGDGSTKVTTPCGSYHPWGLAADFNQVNQSTGNWMRANYSGYGFSHLGWDLNHYQDSRGKTSGQCGRCTADGPDGELPPSSSSPSANFANAIRQALGMQQQPVAQPQPPIQPQPLPQTQSPTGAFEEPKPIPISTTTESTNPDSQTESIADKLEKLAQGDKGGATTTQSATSIPIVIDGNDVGTLKSTQNPDVTATTSGIGGSITQNTFISDDLAWQNEGNQTFGMYAKILASIRMSLLRLLQILVPFGGAQEPYVNPIDVPFE